MMGVSGCGVGVDETADGQPLVTSTGQSLTATPEGSPLVGPAATGPVLPQTAVTTAPSPVRNPGTVALPQDPIPVYEGRTGAPPSPIR